MSMHQLWQSLVTEEEALRHDLENLKELFTKRVETLLAKPGLIRPVFAFLREHDPIFIAPKLAVVSTYADVLEVLEHDAEFAVTEIYAAKMERTTGDFVLGMANTPQYQYEIGVMRQATRPEDLEAIRQFVAECAGSLVQQAQATGSIDAVGGLSRLVPTRLVGHYFGTPGPDDATMMRWMRAIFRDIFLNLSNDAGIRDEADAAAKDLHAYLDELITTRKSEIAAHPDDFDDYLSRLLKMQQQGSGPDNATIRRILGGIIVGTVDTNSKAIAQALDQLLDRPDHLKAAQQAALADNDALLSRYVFEALRFSPQNPFLIRYCTTPYIVAQGTERAKQIPQGSFVVVGTMSAMFDPAKVTEPDQFRIDRPDDNYIHFGHGQHTCFGRHIAHIQIPQAAKALLRCGGLRRAEGDDGRLQYDGAFPDRWIVRFESS